MKKGYVRALLSTDNEKAYLATVEEDQVGNHYHGLLQVLAQVADQAAAGEDIYATFGRTKSNDALILTVIWEGARTYAAGANLEAVSEVCETLIDN